MEKEEKPDRSRVEVFRLAMHAAHKDHDVASYIRYRDAYIRCIMEGMGWKGEC